MSGVTCHVTVTTEVLPHVHDVSTAFIQSCTQLKLKLKLKLDVISMSNHVIVYSHT